MKADNSADIAIIGMAGLFPKAPNVQAFWSNILNKVDATCEAPEGWLGDEIFRQESRTNDTRVYTTHGGFLGELGRFDPRPYGIMPVSIEGGEPDQFLALRCATEALADSGYTDGRFDPEKIGIILGHAVHANRASVNGVQQALILDQTCGLLHRIFPEITADKLAEFRRVMRAQLPTLNADGVPGLVPNMMTGRIANRLNLMGPNYILDAACSSSLLAIAAAITELRSGRCDLMLAGGINTSTSSMVYMLFCEIGALSRSSKVRPFDRDADGTLLGEGQGIVVLKRCADALRDGDRIYAVIKGIGSSSDGRATGLMAPRLEGEILAMAQAYRQTGLDPATIGLVEAHGTGIPLGDRTEIQALRQIFGERTKGYPEIALGSVKSMIGHCIPAAGAASVIKLALALYHKVLPPTLCEEISPDLGLEKTLLFLNTEASPWINAGKTPRRAAVNAFGFGGINAHLILEEAPGSGGTVEVGAAFGVRAPGTSELVVFSKPTRDALIAAVTQMKERLAAAPAASLTVVAAEAVHALEAGSERLAIIASSIEDLSVKLGQVLTKLADAQTQRVQSRRGVYFSSQAVEGKIAFIFPGENSQYPGMLKDLALISPIVREWLDFLEALFAGERDVPHRFLIFPPPNSLTDEERQRLERRLLDVDAGSESVFCVDQAMFALLRALQIKPDFMVGHSTGENAALVASGVLDFTREDTATYIREMNKVYQSLEDAQAIPKGVLLTVGAVGRDAVLGAIEGRDGVYFTMDNCPNQVVLFGPEATMEAIAEELSRKGGICSRLPLAWAYHTPLIEPMAQGFNELFHDAAKKEPIAALYSCSSAGPFPNERKAMQQLAVNQYVTRVRFTETIERLYDDGARIFIEVGPSGNLTAFVRDILKDRPHLAVASNVRRQGGIVQFQQLLAQLFCAQVPMDLRVLFPPTVVAAAAALTPAPARPTERPLASELPYVKITAEEGARLRELFQPDLSAGAPASGEVKATTEATSPPMAATASEQALQPAQAAGPPAVAGNGSGPQPAVVLDGKTGQMIQHFALMNQFLSQHGAVTSAMAARRPGHNHRPWVQDWNRLFAVPYPVEVQFAGYAGSSQGGPSTGDLEALAKGLLSASELAFWREQLAGRNVHRGQEWLLGRLAGKQAVRMWLARHYRTTALVRDIEILSDQSGAPVVGLRNGLKHLQDLPVVSISHVDGCAVAVAADHRRRTGVDLERITRVRDAAGFADRVVAKSEQAVLRHRLPGSERETGVLVWSIKEAAAKALGVGFLGREKEFVLTALSPDDGRGQVLHNGDLVNVQVRRLGDYYCALAYCSAENAGRPIPHQ